MPRGGPQGHPPLWPPAGGSIVRFTGDDDDDDDDGDDTDDCNGDGDDGGCGDE